MAEQRLIQVGQVLDKYELLERVGQGGMAIVYRGIDRQLKRTVAIKVLHKHLSDYQEARDRFEREAQAVAKLRHENILEIFDYSAKEGFESYIVTEFIDGQTLKQFVTDRPIAFPEIGAMIILQVCRALAHAHAASILHRDVKPENIMIRGDGIVKLMDFGISHMVDLERLTVTGQLLGSPAYMAPEHVEGRPLDFRTDVFAAGIVLYQLCVGKLPFEGKNPHEVLKRIAECRFLDPRQANPRIGNRLGRIILKAMAAQPNDRYAAIGEMVLAIEAYLEESGLPPDKIPAELARYFQAPASYEAALKARLVDTLTRTGKLKLDGDDRAGALDVFDRVLTIDPENAVVLQLLDKLNRRARMQTVAIATLAIMVLAFGGYMIHERSTRKDREPGETPVFNVDDHGNQQMHGTTQHETKPPDGPQVAGIDAAAHDATQIAVVVHDAQPMHAGIDAEELVTNIDAQLEPVEVEINSVIPGSRYSVDGGSELKTAAGHTFNVTVKDHPVTVAITNDLCTKSTLTIDRTMKTVSAQQQWAAASVRAHCDAPKSVPAGAWNVSVRIGVTVQPDGKIVGGRIAQLDSEVTVPFGSGMSSTKQITVEFSGGKTGAETVATKTVVVTAGNAVNPQHGPSEVTCDLH